MISLRLALGRLEDRRLPNRVCPQKAADVLGADLNCSESRCCCGTPAGPCPSWVDTVERILAGASRATLISRSRANSKLFKPGHVASSSFAHAFQASQVL